jgi:hypothetical protein
MNIVELTSRELAHGAPRGARARVSPFTIPWGTLPPLLLSHAIENQNSDFVMAIGIKPIELYIMTKSEF